MLESDGLGFLATSQPKQQELDLNREIKEAADRASVILDSDHIGLDTKFAENSSQEAYKN